MMAEFQIAREYADGADLLKDVHIDAVSICVPNYQHGPMVLAALKAGKHVLCERPPALNPSEARRMDAAAKKAGKVLLYGYQRRFGGHEQAARAAIQKGFIGDAYHARCVWTRMRGIPLGTGWFTQKSQSGGGALMDIGSAMLDIGWHLLGNPKPTSAFGITQSRFGQQLRAGSVCDVEDAAFALVKFEGGKSLELAASWAINQPPHQNGTVCRIYGSAGAIEVHTPQGAMLLTQFQGDGQCKQNPLKPPKLVGHAAMMRHFRECILGKAMPLMGGPEGVTLMEMLHAIYRSAESGKGQNV